VPVDPAARFARWIEDQPTEDQPLLRAATGLDTGSAPLEGPPAVGIAVSGGGDSMALLHLLAAAAPQIGIRVEAATVDHRLRPEAAEEAAFVAGVCAARDIAHQTLVWTDHPGTGNLMQAASEARRRLLASWARSRGLARVAMAHTADDQAEGFLMALARGSGLDGLCGMRRDWTEQGMGFVRPLLAVSRRDLRAFLVRHGHAWRDDPTNEDDRFARARIRKAMQVLEGLDISAGPLNATMRNLADVRHLLDRTLAGFFERHVASQAGALALKRAAYLDLPMELRRRFLSAVIRWMSGARHAPRHDQLFALSMNIRDHHAATLGGCMFVNDGKVIGIVREPNAVQPRVAWTELWDHRWMVEGPGGEGLEVGALGEDGLRQCPDWRKTGLARQCLVVTPGIWDGARLVSAPLAGWDNGWSARLDAPGGLFGRDD
jgi:tRNA(Ile)-lysidine synthase